jgi:ABC-type Mn2+/Zn2+ transport system permease subunit
MPSAERRRLTAVDWLIEPFALAFQQRALVAGLLAAITTSTVGTWVVIRGMSFMGDALVHGVVPGIAMAVLFGFDPLIGATVAAIVMIAGIDLVHRQTRFSEDTGIGLLFVGMLALGVIFISRTNAYSGSLTAILFGDVLGVAPADIVVLAVVAGLAVAASAALYRPFLVLSFNRSKASMLGLRPDLAHVAMLALITMAVVGSFRTVGTLLVFGLLVGPPATAALLVRRVPTMMLTAVGLGVLAVVLGLIICYHAGTAGSATMAAVSIAGFFLVLAIRAVFGRGTV